MTKLEENKCLISGAVESRIKEIAMAGNASWQFNMIRNAPRWIHLLRKFGKITLLGWEEHPEETFRVIVDSIAHMAFRPGGFSFLGCHFEAQFTNE